MTMGANLQILNSEFSSNEASDNCGVGLILNNEAVSNTIRLDINQLFYWS